MPNAVRLYAVPAGDGSTLLCAAGMQVISKHRIENPTPEQLQAMAHQEYPHIPAADWYIVDDPTRHRFEIIYISY